MVSVRPASRQHARPAGDVLIAAVGRILTVVPLASGATTPIKVLVRHVPRSIVAGYRGDGLFKPSVSRAVRG
jgi:hypothetical protein